MSRPSARCREPAEELHPFRLAGLGVGEEDVEQVLATGVVRAGVVGDVLPPAVRAGRALRPGAGQYQPADQRGPGEGHVLGDEAPKGEAKQVRPGQADRIGEGDNLPCGLGNRVRGHAGGRADAGVVDEDDLALGRQGIDERRVLVVEVAAKVLQHQQRHVAGGSFLRPGGHIARGSWLFGARSRPARVGRLHDPRGHPPARSSHTAGRSGSRRSLAAADPPDEDAATSEMSFA